ncbi:MAG: TIGR00725 family protein [Nitrososphaera sp.]
MRRTQIAVIGYNGDRCTEAARSLAYEVGKEIAKSGAVLVCGGLGGVMEAACRGAKENGGMTVGIIPQEEFSFANEYCDIVICTGIGFARDFVVASSADGMIAVAGGVGTLIELSVGYMMKKPMAAIAGSGGTADQYGGKYLDERKRVPIMSAQNPAEAVALVLEKARKDVTPAKASLE